MQNDERSVFNYRKSFVDSIGKKYRQKKNRYTHTRKADEKILQVNSMKVPILFYFYNSNYCEMGKLFPPLPFHFESNNFSSTYTKYDVLYEYIHIFKCMQEL